MQGRDWANVQILEVLFEFGHATLSLELKIVGGFGWVCVGGGG